MGRHKFFQGMRFMAGGSIAVIVYWAILYTLTEYLHVWYVASSAFGWFTSYVVSFIVQKFWTFKNRDENAASKQFRLYIMMAIGVLIANTTLLYVFVEYIKLEYIFAQIIIASVLSTASFFITRKIFVVN